MATSRWYPAEITTDAEFADNIALFANTFIQAEYLLNSLEPAVGGISLHVNANKTEYIESNLF